MARAALLATLCIGMITPASMSATHQEVRVTIQVQHYNDVNLAVYTIDSACNGTYCFVQIPVNNRDTGRVLRWCGDTTVDLLIEANHSGALTECYGSSTWKVRVIAGLRIDDENVTSHPEDVAVEIQLIKG
jgi:hypothetical protein